MSLVKDKYLVIVLLGGIITIVVFLYLHPCQSKEYRNLVLEIHEHKPVNNWSDTLNISIEEPQCAYINIYETRRLPKRKGTKDIRARLEYHDNNGNTFDKPVWLYAQGQSTLAQDKRNIGVRFCDKNEDSGDLELELSIGNWVPQKEFHLKANWYDCFRGSQTFSYKLYEQMNPSEGQELYHPDGFPCIVYLNGEFYGIYAWQLKKNRKNMGLTKNNPCHIWLDGTLSNSTFFNGEIKWESFEIRNPKHPTSSVIDSIKSFSRFCSLLTEIESNGTDSVIIKKALDCRLDIKRVIDYICFIQLTNNADGYAKNWQWVTTDGHRWSVYPYDLDGCFGYELGHFVNDGKSTWIKPTGPLLWVWNYYREEIRDRWNDLRLLGIFDIDNIMNLAVDWTSRIGEDNYTKEKMKWPQAPCYNDFVPDPHWELVSGYKEIPYYDPKKIYEIGDSCFWDFRIWKAVQRSKGNLPYIKYGYKDSMDRLKQWVDDRLMVEDEFMNQ